MRIAIIGNGAAGNQAAAVIKQIEPEHEIFIFSREPHPLYSPCVLPDCLAGHLQRANVFLKDLAAYKREGVITHFDEVVESLNLNQQEVVSDKNRYSYDRLIIATGGRPFIPQVKGSRLPGTFTLKTLEDMDRLKQTPSSRVVVVGSGNIGIEAAQAMNDRGCQVTIIESLGQVMPRLFDEKPALIIRILLERTGIQVLTGETVREVRGRERVEEIVTDQRILPCDTLIWAAGMKPECELAAAAGLESGELGGIKVNRQMQCSKPNVYACGDCAESFDAVSGKPVLSMLWPTARRQAQIAAMNCLGQEAEYEGAFNMVVEEIDNIPIAAVGLKEDHLKGEAHILEKENGPNCWRILFENNRVVGMQAVGSLEYVGVVAGLIRKRFSRQEIEDIISDSGLMLRTPWTMEALRRYLPPHVIGGITGGKSGSIH